MKLTRAHLIVALCASAHAYPQNAVGDILPSITKLQPDVTPLPRGEGVMEYPRVPPLPSIPTALTGTYTPSWLSSALAANVTETPNKNITTTALPTPTPASGGLPAMYPDPGDCNQNLTNPSMSGPDLWKQVNATDTLACWNILEKEAPNFLNPLAYDGKLAHYYGATNPRFACGIDPTQTAADQCQDDGHCYDLAPMPLQPPPSNTSGDADLGYACDLMNHNLKHKSTGYLVINSMINLSSYLGVLYADIQAAAQNASDAIGPNGVFSKEFIVPPPDTVTAKRDGLAAMGAILSIITAFAGVLFPEEELVTLAPQIAGPLASGAGSIAMANASLASSQPDINGWFGNIVGTLENAYLHWSDGIFKNGSITLPPRPGAGPVTVTMLDVIADGNWAGTLTFGENNQSAVSAFEQAMFAQLAQTAWTVSDGLLPFISVTEGNCVNSQLPNTNFTQQQSSEISWSNVSTVIDGKCYSLLGAASGTCTIDTNPYASQGQDPSSTYECCQFSALPGGNSVTLSGSDTQYGGLKFDDMITSAVSGWMLNKQVNGYDAWNITNGFSGPSAPKNMSSVGLVSEIPICDYTKPDAPGINCPNIMGDGSNCAF